MNAGFSNLDTLKRQLLAEAIASGANNYDVQIKSLGLGVKKSFEKFCNRKMDRAAGDTYTFPGDRDEIVLPRYPLESVDKVEILTDLQSQWTDITASLLNFNADTGICYFNGRLGMHFTNVRVTFTGGFFWETLEPADGGFPSLLPDGATALPDDLKLAWLMQCEITWKGRDALGLSLTDNASKSAQTLPDVKLAPEVQRMISSYRRFQIT